MAWTDAQQNPHDYLAPGAGVGYSGGISGQYPIGLGVGNYAGALRLGGAPSAGSVPNPTARPTFPGSLIPLPSGRPGSSPGPFGAVGNAGPRGATNAAPVSVSQALATSATKGGRSPPGYQGVATVPEIESYIRERAGLLGMDQDYAVAVFRGEGRSGYIGDQSLGGSYGPYQLYMGGGVGNRFVKDTGLDLRDPSTWRQQVDYALNTAINEGWGAWNGRPGGRSGPTRVGLNGAQAIGGYGSSDTIYGGTMPNPNMRPGRTTDARGGPMSPGQFLSAIGPQPRPIGPNDYLVPPGQNIDALTYTGEPAASPTNAVFRLPNANTPPPVSPAATPSIAGGQPYTVKPNDTLWGIAAQTLGDPTQWPTIAQANGIRRGQERNIQPGQQLMIPGGTPAGPPPMPNTTAQGLGPMPPVPTPQANPHQFGTPATGFNTPLSLEQEAQFQRWKSQYAPNDSGENYDLRGAFLAGFTPGPDGHWFDTFKKPSHPTFSNESIYAKYAPNNAGSWNGDRYMTAPGNMPTPRLRPGNQPGPFSATSPDIGASDLTLTRARLLGRNDQNVVSPPQLAQVNPDRFSGQAKGPIIPRTPEEASTIRQQLFNSATQRRGMMGTPETQMSIDRPSQAPEPPSLPAGPGMDMSGYIPPVSRMEKALGNVPMALPTQQTPMDPSLAAAIARTPAVISDREIRIITARTPPVYVAPDGSRIWQIR